MCICINRQNRILPLQVNGLQVTSYLNRSGSDWKITTTFLCCSGTFFLMEKALALRGREGEGERYL